MNRRAWIILFPAWAMVVLPALCTAGILNHPCSGDDCDQPVHRSHEQNERGCPHESDCAQDPCHGLTACPQQKDSYAHILNSASAFLFAPLVAVESAQPSYFFRAVYFAVLTLPNLPYPESAFPLLI